MGLTLGQIIDERAALVAEALSWRGTPYHNHARVKGAGCDCLTFVAGAFEAAHLVDHVDLPYYPAQWHLHGTEELYVEGLLVHCDEIAGPPDRAPEPGDVIIWRFHNTFSHGGIVIAWPNIVHCFLGRGVGQADATREAPLVVVNERNELRGQPRPRRFFRLKRWAL